MNITQEECFETETGTPTLTIVLPKEQRMIPYSGFRDAVMEHNRIIVRFHDWLLAINGKSLMPLWQQFQMQDVRIVRQSQNPVDGECSISRIELKEAEHEPP